MHQFSSPMEFAVNRELIRAEIQQLGSGKAELLYVALNEAVNNAFMHGYGGAANATVEVMIYTEKGQIVIKVRHKGQGLQTVCQTLDSSEPSLEEHGRGLSIIRGCTDFVEYSGDGREIIMRKTISTTS